MVVEAASSHVLGSLDRSPKKPDWVNRLDAEAVQRVVR